MSKNNPDENKVQIAYVRDKKNYQKFGKLAYNKNHLENNKLRMVYWSSLASKGKVVEISNDLVEFINDVVANKENFNMYNFFLLKPDEQKLIVHYLKLSGMDKEIGFKYDQYCTTRLKILQGEMSVGNDSPEIIVEAKQVVRDLYRLKKITKKRLDELLDSLD